MERRIFPEGLDAKNLPYEDYRWKRFKNSEPGEMYRRRAEHVFPFLRTLGEGSTYAHTCAMPASPYLRLLFWPR